MSAEPASSAKAVEVYIPLRNEGTEVLRPTKAIVLSDDVFQILATVDYHPALEEWEFPPGSKVKCVLVFKGGQNVLVARQRIA